MKNNTGVDDFLERKTLEGVNEDIIDNIRIKKLELEEDLMENGGIISLKKSGIFRMIRRGGELVMIETTPGDNIEGRYDKLKNVFSYLNERGYAYNKFKIESIEDMIFGVIVRADNLDIIEEMDIDNNSTVRRIDTSDTEIKDSVDAYEIIRSQYKTKSEIIFYEWKSFNHLSWYAWRPFWMRIFDEAIFKNNI